MPKTTYQCTRCGKPFLKWACQVKNVVNVFCSKACSNFKTGQQRTCPSCGKSFYATASSIAMGYSTHCSRKCSNPARGRAGTRNGNWKGGFFIRSDGYVAVGVVGWISVGTRFGDGSPHWATIVARGKCPPSKRNPSRQCTGKFGIDNGIPAHQRTSSVEKSSGHLDGSVLRGVP